MKHIGTEKADLDNRAPPCSYRRALRIRTYDYRRWVFEWPLSGEENKRCGDSANRLIHQHATSASKVLPQAMPRAGTGDIAEVTLTTNAPTKTAGHK